MRKWQKIQNALKSTPGRTRHKGGTKDRKHGMWEHEQKAHHPHDADDDDEHHDDVDVDNGSTVSMFFAHIRYDIASPPGQEIT